MGNPAYRTAINFKLIKKPKSKKSITFYFEREGLIVPDDIEVNDQEHSIWDSVWTWLAAAIGIFMLISQMGGF